MSEQQTATNWVLVGRFLTDRPVNSQVMKSTLASIWRSMKGVFIKDLNPDLFLFHFFHGINMQRVITRGPWTFDRHLLITKPLVPSKNPTRVHLSHVDFWVQVFDLLYGFLAERVAKGIGNYIATYIKGDPKSFDGVWKEHVRIRVSMDARKPLKRRMKIKKPGGSGIR